MPIPKQQFNLSITPFNYEDVLTGIEVLDHLIHHKNQCKVNGKEFDETIPYFNACIQAK